MAEATAKQLLIRWQRVKANALGIVQQNIAVLMLQHVREQ